MIRALAAAAAIHLWYGTPAFAHRLDEYLQAIIIRVEKDRVQAQVYLTPGVEVFPAVLADIDTDRDGAISEAERRAYAERVLRDLSLTIDGTPLRLRLVSTNSADIEELKQGRGDIQIEFIADVPRSGVQRKLIYENRHETRIGAYLVNCLVPRDPDVRITAQKRNYQQSLYELNYVQAGVRQEPLSVWWSGTPVWVGTATLLLLATAHASTASASPNCACALMKLSLADSVSYGRGFQAGPLLGPAAIIPDSRASR